MGTGRVREPQELKILRERIRKADTIGISGHINPDGDCIGSCLALCTYLRENYPDKTVDVFLEPVNKKFLFLKYASDIIQPETAVQSGLKGIAYDVFFSLDCSETDRLGFALDYFNEASFRVCVDHHITNKGFGDLMFIRPGASSTAEILFTMMKYYRISHACAESLYLGIIHDTGVFRHTNTSRQTMETAGALLDKGVAQDRIIDETFYRKTYVQNQLLGRALMESILVMDGRVIFTVISRRDMAFYGVDKSDLDGVIDQLRVTEGVEVALLLTEKDDQLYKVSMRSNEYVDVSSIALSFGGGGHVRAAGCTVHGGFRDVINSITAQIEVQMKDLV